MDTRSKGRQVAARVTTVAAVGSLAVAGLGVMVLEVAPQGVGTTAQGSSSRSENSSQLPVTRQSDGAVRAPSGTAPTDVTSQGHVSSGTSFREKVKSPASPVTRGTGGSVSAKSSGS